MSKGEISQELQLELLVESIEKNSSRVSNIILFCATVVTLALINIMIGLMLI